MLCFLCEALADQQWNRSYMMPVEMNLLKHRGRLLPSDSSDQTEQTKLDGKYLAPRPSAIDLPPRAVFRSAERAELYRRCLGSRVSRQLLEVDMGACRGHLFDVMDGKADWKWINRQHIRDRQHRPDKQAKSWLDFGGFALYAGSCRRK